MSSTTALDIINNSLRVLQVASPDVVLTAAEASNALDTLNLMIDSWSNEPMMINHVVKDSLILTPGQAQYTIGTSGNINTDRPIQIESSTITISNSELPLSIVSYDDWAVIRLKTISAYPDTLYFDTAYPLGIINLYPVPSTATTLTLYSLKPFTKFTDLTSIFSLPPGYARAMKYQLAIELAPEYQTSAGPDVIALAQAAKAGIKRVNKRTITMQLDPMLAGTSTGRYNVYRGS